MTGVRHRLGGYQECAPPPPAARVFEAFWVHRTPIGPADPHAAHRVLPDLAVSVAFQVFRDSGGRPWDRAGLDVTAAAATKRARVRRENILTTEKPGSGV